MKKNVEKTMWHIPECYKDVLLKDEKLLEYYYKQTEERFAYEMELSERINNRIYILFCLLSIVMAILSSIYMIINNNYILFFIGFYPTYLIYVILYVLPSKIKSRFFDIKDCLQDKYYVEINKMGDVNYQNTIQYYLPGLVNQLDVLMNYNKQRIGKYKTFLLLSAIYLLLFLLALLF